MRSVLPFLFLAFSCLTAFSQEVPGGGSRNKAVYAELLGNGIGFSLNYDMRLARDRQDGHGLRIGLGGFPVDGTNASGSRVNGAIYSIPLSYNYLVGKRRSAFEMGAGITPIVGRVEFMDFGGDVRQDADVTVAGFLNAGYRYQPLNSGLVFRFTWTPSITNDGFYPAWFGLSLGYGFK